MAPSTRSSLAMMVAAGGMSAAPLFVCQRQSATAVPGESRGVVQDRPLAAGPSSEVSTAFTLAASGAIAVGAVTRAAKAKSSRAGAKTARLAEPISAAAGAAAAAKAASAAAAGKAAAGAAGAKAAAGAAGAKTAGAVGAGAGTGKSLQKEEGGGSGKPDFDPAAQLGAMAPLGYFDPAGFCQAGDEATFRNFRAAEIKHGRVAMMAAVGAVVQHYVQFPGFGSVPTGLGAVNTAPGSFGFAALFIAAGLLELGAWTESPEKEPGNFGDPAGLNMYTEDMRLKELNNGRFAMFAAIGIIAAELYTGKDAIEQFGL